MFMGSKPAMRRFIILTACAALFCGCVSVKNDRSVVPPPALISVVKAPLTTPEGPISCYGLKSGSASDSFYVYEYLFTGISATIWTATLEKAMKNGGITKLYYADYDMSSFLGYVTIFTVRAYGE
jgi:hypothetical protein